MESCIVALASTAKAIKCLLFFRVCILKLTQTRKQPHTHTNTQKAFAISQHKQERDKNVRFASKSSSSCMTATLQSARPSHSPRFGLLLFPLMPSGPVRRSQATPNAAARNARNNSHSNSILYCTSDTVDCLFVYYYYYSQRLYLVDQLRMLIIGQY